MMEHEWSRFKDHFEVEKLPIVGNLEEVVDWYFEIRPPFLENPKSKQKEFPDAFIISALEHHHKQHHANIAVISADGGFRQACARRNYFRHFDHLNDIYRSIPAGTVRRGYGYPETLIPQSPLQPEI